MTKINELANIIKESKNIVFFGGAGVSTASNIPDFRSAQGVFNEKLNRKFTPEQLVSHTYFVRYPEDFYDFLIWKWLKNVPTKEARLIGDILGHSQLGVGDWWYARRIEYYISQGRISIIQDSENKYARLISQPL